MDLDDESYGFTVAPNGQSGREYILHMIRSLSKLAKRWREDEIAILLEAVAAAMRASERGRR